MDPQRLLEQFLGPGGGDRLAGGLQTARDKVAGSGMVGGLAAGGILGLLLGGKSGRRMVGGLVRMGGMAALGALAYRAYQNWQQGKTAKEAPLAAPADSPSADSRFLPASAPGGDGRSFEMSLVLAMIAAANADGHIGPEEQRAIFDQVGKLNLDAEAKSFVFDALTKPPSIAEIAAMAKGPEQGSEIYLAARLAIDPDQASEKTFLEALAHQLRLPADLVAHLERQASGLPLEPAPVAG